jgi:methylated-DNA-protein-cysteine methyltransferase-like protein
MSAFYDRVYIAVKRIPKGRVATYGQIAAIAGNSRAARAVGWALHVNPEPGVIPCHRVINRFGKICEGFAFGGPAVQKRLLEEEGVEVSDDYFVDLSKYGI